MYQKQMKWAKRLRCALLGLCICLLVFALVACNKTNNDDEDIGKIGMSGYYEGKLTAAELMTYANHVLTPTLNADPEVESQGGYVGLTYYKDDIFGAMWGVEFADLDENNAGIFILSSDALAEEMYMELSIDDDYYDYNIIRVGNRIIMESEQNVIKNYLMSDITPSVPKGLSSMMDDALHEAMKYTHVIEEAPLRSEFAIQIIILNYTVDNYVEYKFGCEIPTYAYGNCWIDYGYADILDDHDLAVSERECEEANAMIGSKYTEDSFYRVDKDEMYFSYLLEDKPGFYFEDILDKSGEPTDEATLIGYNFNDEAGLNVITPSVTPDGKRVTKIDRGAFCRRCDCIQSITISEGVTSLPDGVFGECDNLSKIVIPSTVEDIKVGEGFMGSDRLEIIEVSPTNAKYKVDGNCIIEKASNKLILGCANSTIPSYVECIGKFAFANCFFTNTKFVIPDSVTVIEDYAFYNCRGLIEINIPKNVSKIGYGIFAYCYNLVEVCNESSLQLSPEHLGVRNVYDPLEESSKLTYRNDGSVFYEDESGCYLVSYKATDKVVRLPSIGKKYIIGQYVFYRSDIKPTFIALSDDVQGIEVCAFGNCYSLQTIVISDSVESIGRLSWLGELYRLKTVYYEGTSEQWDDMDIDESYYNDELLDAKRYYYSEQPNYDGKHWHWNSQNMPEVWSK